jgi:hypothetical protein
MLSLVLGITKWHIMHSFLGTAVISFSLAIIRDSDAFFNCPARIETLSIAFSTSTLSPVRAVDRFSTVLSVSVKSLL